MPLTRADISDAQFLDKTELAAGANAVFLSGIAVVSTNAGTKRIVFSGVDIQNLDAPVESGDFVRITGSAAAGTYTVNSVIDAVTLDVVEAIVTSAGGTADMLYPPGATQIGLDPTGLVNISSPILQEALESLDAAVAAGITPATHQTLRQLIHLAEGGGPFEGFASGAYRETLPAADPFPTSIIWWESAAKLKKIVEETVTYNANKTIATDQWKVYATDGVTVLATVTDTITYTGVFETSRTRTIV